MNSIRDIPSCQCNQPKTWLDLSSKDQWATMETNHSKLHQYTKLLSMIHKWVCHYGSRLGFSYELGSFQEGEGSCFSSSLIYFHT